jgi:hypothetical protein
LAGACRARHTPVCLQELLRESETAKSKRSHLPVRLVQKFEQALNYEPRNPIFLGGLASFLYLHGDPREAFAKHLALIKLERSLGNEAKVLSIAQALRTLGQRIGLPPAAVDGLIDES